jgi:hypothetical protein
MSGPAKKVHSLIRRHVRAALLTVAGALAAAGALAGGVLGATSAEVPVPPQATGAPASSVEPALRSGFALLRRAQDAQDGVPGSVTAVFSGASGANLALARRVADAQQDEAWIVPGSGSACILARNGQLRIGGAVCTSSAAALRGELNVQSASSSLPGGELVAGIVPDGVRSVTLTLADGSRQLAAVREGIYLALVHGAVTSIGASGPQGALSIPAMSASSSSPRLER